MGPNSLGLKTRVLFLSTLRLLFFISFQFSGEGPSKILLPELGKEKGPPSYTAGSAPKTNHRRHSGYSLGDAPERSLLPDQRAEMVLTTQPVPPQPLHHKSTVSAHRVLCKTAHLLICDIHSIFRLLSIPHSLCILLLPPCKAAVTQKDSFRHHTLVYLTPEDRCKKNHTGRCLVP